MDSPFPYSKFTFENDDLFNGLPDSVFSIRNKNKRKLFYKEGDIIFREGDCPQGVYRVTKGLVKKTTQTHFRLDHLFYLCKTGEYFGHHALLSDEDHNDTAVALTACQLTFIPKEDFLKALELSHELTHRLLKSLGHEFNVFVSYSKILAKHTVRERMAIFILVLHEKFKLDLALPNPILLSRDDLASLVGTTKESVVRTLRDFKEQRLIQVGGRSIYVRDAEGLLKITNL